MPFGNSKYLLKSHLTPKIVDLLFINHKWKNGLKPKCNYFVKQSAVELI